MSGTHLHLHHRHAPSTRFSLLRASAIERLGFALAAAAGLWLIVAWAMGWFA